MNDMSNHASNVGQFLANNKTSRKKNPAVFLTDHDKWELAKYMIENKLVYLDKEGKFIKFRMFVKGIIEEVKSLDRFKDMNIRDHQLRVALGFYETVNSILGHPISVPIQDSLQEDMLKIELSKVMTERDKLRKQVDNMNQLYAKVVIRLEDDAKYMTMAFTGDYVASDANKKITLK